MICKTVKFILVILGLGMASLNFKLSQVEKGKYEIGQKIWIVRIANK